MPTYVTVLVRMLLSSVTCALVAAVVAYIWPLSSLLSLHGAELVVAVLAALAATRNAFVAGDEFAQVRHRGRRAS